MVFSVMDYTDGQAVVRDREVGPMVSNIFQKISEAHRVTILVINIT